MWIKTLNLIITPMVYSTLPLIHIGPDANYYWEQKMDRYLDAVYRKHDGKTSLQKWDIQNFK